MSWSGADVPDLAGTAALVTGANSGLGLEVATVLAQHGARVLLGSRDEAKGDAAAGRILRRAVGAEVEVIRLDVADLAQIASVASELSDRVDKLDLLVNNAGVMAIDRASTADGFELQFGVNHLGAFALTCQLMPLLQAAPHARVVAVSSVAHQVGRLDFDDIMGERHYGRWRAYAQSKLANLLFTLELQRRLTERHARTIAVAAHPGLTHTNLGHGGTGLTNRFLVPVPPFAQPVRSGALPILRAATDPDAAPGSFWGPRLGLRGAPVQQTPSAAARDDATARRLWTLSAELTGTDL